MLEKTFFKRKDEFWKASYFVALNQYLHCDCNSLFFGKLIHDRLENFISSKARPPTEPRARKFGLTKRKTNTKKKYDNDDQNIHFLQKGVYQKLLKMITF